jgi:hypothetical protein
MFLSMGRVSLPEHFTLTEFILTELMYRLREPNLPDLMSGSMGQSSCPVTSPLKMLSILLAGSHSTM